MLEGRQKAWMSPGVTTANISLESGAKLAAKDFEYASQSKPGLAKIMSQDGTGSNSQQISASIIKKIQNNYQVSVTNTGYDSSMTTASAQALNQITMKLKNESTSVLPYLHALLEISDVYPQNQALNTLCQ